MAMKVSQIVPVFLLALADARASRATNGRPGPSRRDSNKPRDSSRHVEPDGTLVERADTSPSGERSGWRTASATHMEARDPFLRSLGSKDTYTCTRSGFQSLRRTILPLLIINGITSMRPTWAARWTCRTGAYGGSSAHDSPVAEHHSSRSDPGRHQRSIPSVSLADQHGREARQAVDRLDATASTSSRSTHLLPQLLPRRRS